MTNRKYAAIAERLDRLAFYGLVKRLRGEEAAKALAADVSAEWRKTTT